jgi:hypothetical protein
VVKSRGQMLFLIGFTSMLLFFAGCDNPTGTNESLGSAGPSGGGATYEVGDVGPAGGLIFFVDADNQYPGWTYLEAAPSDWFQDSGDPAYTFSSGSLTSFPVTSTAPGAGKDNTADILAGSTVSSATFFASNASVNGFDDWYLPSYSEVELMYINLLVEGAGDFVSASDDTEIYYWSSSVNANATLWATNMNPPDPPLDESGFVPLNQSIRFTSGNHLHYIRPVRRF